MYHNLAIRCQLTFGSEVAGSITNLSSPLVEVVNCTLYSVTLPKVLMM